MAFKPKPERTDVVIIGAGASGAAAAKVLCEAGVKVVALEKGPWRRKESFGGDELANINRYNLWPDPILNPRTWRETAADASRIENFCPVPQMVGGGTVHWQGWLPRFTPNDFRMRTVAGELKGASLADWPITYDELEPYYLKVEWAFGVSGQAGANRFEGRALRRLSLSTHAGLALRPKIHAGLRGARLERLSHPAGRAVASLQRPQGDGGQRLCAAARRSDRDALVGLERLRAARPGDRQLRSAARSATCANSCSTARASIKAAVYQDADGDTVEQEADVFILACGAMETARLMLLSQSGRFPNGLANGSDLVGRNVTFHEYSAAVGTYDDPVYAWAGGGYVSASTFQHYEHDPSRGFVSGGHIAVAGVGIPLPINWRLPGTPTWGAEAKKIDREEFSHSLAVAMVLHDMPQHDNRIELDDEVVDAWGLPGHPRDAEAAPERSRPGPLPDRPRRRHPRSERRPVGHQSLRRPHHRQLLAPARHGPHGRRPGHERTQPLVPRPRGRESLCCGRLALPDRHRRQPDPDHHGQRLACGGKHRCGAGRRGEGLTPGQSTPPPPSGGL